MDACTVSETAPHGRSTTVRSMEERKERWRLTEENIDMKVEIAVEKKSSQTVATAVAAAKQVVTDLSTSLVTGVFTWTRQNPEKM